jgi:hypothetical protein
VAATRRVLAYANQDEAYLPVTVRAATIAHRALLLQFALDGDRINCRGSLAAICSTSVASMAANSVATSRRLSPFSIIRD